MKSFLFFFFKNMRALYILLVASWAYIAISSYFNHQWHHDDLDSENSNLSIAVTKAKGLRFLPVHVPPPQQQQHLAVQLASPLEALHLSNDSSYYARAAIKNSTGGIERGQESEKTLRMIQEKHENLKRKVKQIQVSYLSNCTIIK